MADEKKHLHFFRFGSIVLFHEYINCYNRVRVRRRRRRSAAAK